MTFILAKLQAEGSMAASVFYNYSFRDACENSFSQNFQTENSGKRIAYTVNSFLLKPNVSLWLLT